MYVLWHSNWPQMSVLLHMCFNITHMLINDVLWHSNWPTDVGRPLYVFQQYPMIWPCLYCTFCLQVWWSNCWCPHVHRLCQQWEWKGTCVHLHEQWGRCRRFVPVAMCSMIIRNGVCVCVCVCVNIHLYGFCYSTLPNLKRLFILVTLCVSDLNASIFLYWVRGSSQYLIRLYEFAWITSIIPKHRKRP